MRSFLANLFTSNRDYMPRIHAEKLPNGEMRVEISIRVWLYRENDLWVAQGIDLDYVASGSSKREVKKRFGDGLRDTIDLHLEEFGSLKEFARPAPENIQQEFFRAALMKDIRPEIKPCKGQNFAFYPQPA